MRAAGDKILEMQTSQVEFFSEKSSRKRFPNTIFLKENPLWQEFCSIFFRACGAIKIFISPLKSLTILTFRESWRKTPRTARQLFWGDPGRNANVFAMFFVSVVALWTPKPLLEHLQRQGEGPGTEPQSAGER